MALYPAGYFARQITVAPERAAARGLAVRHRARDCARLERRRHLQAGVARDAGRFADLRREVLQAASIWIRAASRPVHMDIVADRAELLEMKPEQLTAHRALVQQAYKLFGSHHYEHYDFLVALTDHLGGIGLEHHQSSEDGTVPGYFTEWDRNADVRDLLAHEYTHSWNGKFRRPADLWTPNFNVPMRDSLLWVYEGQTQYWGYVLAARSGLLTKQQALDAFALTAAQYDRARRPRVAHAGRHDQRSDRGACAARCRGEAGSAAKTTTPKAS